MTKELILSKVKNIIKRNSQENWVFDNIKYLVLSGSRAIGINSPKSDYDVIGFAVPSRRYIFPYSNSDNFIFGFDNPTVWNSFQVINENIDLKVYNIAHFLALCAKGAPNAVEILFSLEKNVISNTTIGRYLLENRHMFLTKTLVKSLMYMGGNHYDKAMSYKGNDVAKFRKSLCIGFKCCDYAWQIITGKNLKLDNISPILTEIRNGKEMPFDIDIEGIREVEKRAILQNLEINQMGLKDQVDRDDVRQLLKKSLLKTTDCWYY